MNRIGELREQLSLTQKELVERIDVKYIDTSIISKCEKGKINLIPVDTHKLCLALNQPIERVFHPSDLDYGITRSEANKPPNTLANVDTHKLKDSIRCRVPLETKSQLRKCFESDGFTTEQAFLLWWVTKYIKGKAAKAGGTAKAAANENILSTK